MSLVHCRLREAVNTTDSGRQRAVATDAGQTHNNHTMCRRLLDVANVYIAAMSFFTMFDACADSCEYDSVTFLGTVRERCLCEYVSFWTTFREAENGLKSREKNRDFGRQID
jgi:hypothetical protein